MLYFRPLISTWVLFLCSFHAEGSRREGEEGVGIMSWDRERRSLQYIAIAYSYLFIYSQSCRYVYIVRER